MSRGLEATLVPDRWYVVLACAELPAGRPLGVTRLGVKLVLWRDEAGALRCTADRCPHRGAALSAGRVTEGCLECPFHGFRFDGAGACTRIPADGDRRAPPPQMRTRAYEVREAHGFVWLWWGERREDLPELPWFADLDASYAWDGFVDDWQAHYSRVIENQLDFTHLPFVHRDTIGRGVPGPLSVRTEVDGDRIRATYDPATFDAGAFFVELIAPNLWRNRLATGIWVVVAFVPVDVRQTRLYLRFYQNVVAVPGLGRVVCWAANLLNRYVLAQDKRVVLTQVPQEAGEGPADVLVASDGPIAAWRRWEITNRRGGPMARTVAS